MKAKTSASRRKSFEQDDPQLMTDINTTPLIDVMLVLLVMLIITIPIQMHAVDLEMPVGKPPVQSATPEKIQIDINASSQVLWQGQLVSGEELREKMAAVAVGAPQTELHIRPDRASSYAAFANLLATSNREGLTRVIVTGHEQFVE